MSVHDEIIQEGINFTLVKVINVKPDKTIEIIYYAVINADGKEVEQCYSLEDGVDALKSWDDHNESLKKPSPCITP